jgi:hypothetical protein
MDGTLTLDELKEGLSKVQLFEIFANQNIDGETGDDAYSDILE